MNTNLKFLIFLMQLTQHILYSTFVGGRKKRDVYHSAWKLCDPGLVCVNPPGKTVCYGYVCMYVSGHDSFYIHNNNMGLWRNRQEGRKCATDVTGRLRKDKITFMISYQNIVHGQYRTIFIKCVMWTTLNNGLCLLFSAKSNILWL